MHIPVGALPQIAQGQNAAETGCTDAVSQSVTDRAKTSAWAKEGAMNLEDIASLAGVSRSTVSRVINNHPRVSDKARRRVQRVIDEHHYKPNAAARSLVTQRTQTIGVLIPQALPDVFTDPWFPILVQGCLDGCRTHDLSLMLLIEPVTDLDVVNRLVESNVRGRRLDGLVVASSMVDDLLVGRLEAENFPYMLLGRGANPSYSFVDVDNRGSAAAAVAHLLSHESIRPAMIAGPTSMVAANDRVDGFRSAVVEAGFDVTTVPVVHVDYNEEGAYHAALGLLSDDNPPDALFVGSDTMAIGALQAARHLDLVVPDNVRVMGFDGIEPDKTSRHDLSTVRQPASLMGAMAVEQLFSRITHPQADPVQHWMPTELILRGSCGCPSVLGEPEEAYNGKRGENQATAELIRAQRRRGPLSSDGGRIETRRNEDVQEGVVR